MFKPKVVILIFASGKLVVTGGKEESDVFEAVDIVKKTLESKQLISYSE
jgi:transcription initiation factor TFIID TATA-box-binding protein